MKCPRDGTTLNLSLQRQETITRCNKCTGTLINLNSIASLPQQTTDLPPSVNSSMRCPKCNKPMLVIMHQDIEIDVCMDCKLVWLDKGERGKILQLQNNKEGPWYKNIDVPVPDIALNSTHRSGNTFIDAAGDVNLLDFVGEAISGLFSGF